VIKTGALVPETLVDPGHERRVLRGSGLDLLFAAELLGDADDEAIVEHGLEVGVDPRPMRVVEPDVSSDGVRGWLSMPVAQPVPQ